MSDYELSYKEISEKIIRFNKDLITQQLKSYYYNKTYSEILNVNRKELSHSSFLAWILNPSESHGLFEFGIRRFFEIIISSKFFNSDIFDNEILDYIITSDYAIKNVNIETEKTINKDCRIDIYIEIELLINQKPIYIRLIIENKVKSKEGEEQTEKYYKSYINKDDNYKNIFIYLTPISSIELKELKEPECKNKNFIQINYQMIVDNILDISIQQDIDNNIKSIIKDYIQTLSQPSLIDDEENRRSMIMAIGEKERALLTKFWESNEKLIRATLSAISSDPNQNKGMRDKINEALISISTEYSRDKSKYILKYKDYEVEVIKADIGLQTINILKNNNLLNDKIIKELEENKTCGFPLIIEREKMNSIQEKRYRIKNDPELIYNNKNYYVARNWNITNINKFIDEMENLFPGLKYENVD